MTRPVSAPTVSVIIPVYNGGEKFRRCLISVNALSPPPAEVIVVADGDTDGSWKLAEACGARVLKRSVSGGPALARNLGADIAAGDLLFFIDADVTIPPDAIGSVGESFRNDPELDALIGSYDDAPFEENFLSQYKNLLHHYVHQTSNRSTCTFWGACGAIRRHVFLKMGGFDERYRHPSIEDIDLGYRLRNAGYKICLMKQLQVKHLKHWGVLSLLKSDFFQRAFPWTDLILNEGRLVDDLNLRLSSRVSVVAVFMLTAALVASFVSPWMFIPALLSLVLLVGLNRDLYRFFIDKHGLIFCLKTIPWHWLYFFYSGLAFSIGLVKHRFKRVARKR